MARVSVGTVIYVTETTGESTMNAKKGLVSDTATSPRIPAHLPQVVVFRGVCPYPYPFLGSGHVTELLSLMLST